MNRLCVFLFFFPTVLMGDLSLPTIFLIDDSVIACSPSTIKTGETLVVTLGRNHGKELAVWRHADQVSFAMVMEAPPKQMKSFMTYDEFQHAYEIRITKESTGFRFLWEGGFSNEYVFSEPGFYEVHVSDVLESEAGGHKCEITVTNP